MLIHLLPFQFALGEIYDCDYDLVLVLASPSKVIVLSKTSSRFSLENEFFNIYYLA